MESEMYFWKKHSEEFCVTSFSFVCFRVFVLFLFLFKELDIFIKHYGIKGHQNSALAKSTWPAPSQVNFENKTLL